MVLGLGANLGDRLATLEDAVARIRVVCTVRAISRLWETAPVGGPAQPDFLNGAALVDAEPTHAFLASLQHIEAELGRRRVPGVQNAPRTLDIDVLWAEGVVSDDPVLTLPHPRLAGRAFAVLPLLDVLPDAIDPRTGTRYAVPPGAVALSALTLSA